METQPTRVTRRFDYIDGLRAVAVLLVIWTHSTEQFVGMSTQKWMFDIAKEFDFGRGGVVLFFAISGFVIPSSFSGKGALGAKSFVISRFFRLFPLFWISIPVSEFFQKWLYGKSLPLSDILLNFTMIPRAFGARMSNEAYWSLEVELAFYTLCLGIFLTGMLRNSSALFVAFFVTLAFYIYTIVPNPYQLDDAGRFAQHLSIMFWGSLCRKSVDEQNSAVGLEKWWQMIPTIWWLMIFPILGFNEAFVHQHAEPDYIPRYYGSYFIALMLFYFGIQYAKPEFKPLAYIGKISYSIYLFHGSVIYAIFWLETKHRHGEPRHIDLWINVLAVICISILVSSLTYRFIELPMIQYGRNIIRRMRQNGSMLTDEALSPVKNEAAAT